MPPPAKQAFSLVELAIVLVILGLLAGGVLSGQSLIRAAELRSVTTQTSQFMTATMTFKDKYFALPGDMPNATKFWTADVPANCPGDATHYSAGKATCDGDGNGQISYLNTASNESYRFWQHLANAGLIEGSYTGTTDGSNNHSDSAKNVPKAKLSNGLWHTDYRGTSSGWADAFDGDYGNVLMLGASIPNEIAYKPLFKPEEVWNIDTKLDDGKPGQGKIVLLGYGNITDCSNGTDSTSVNADYKLIDATIHCALMVRQIF